MMSGDSANRGYALVTGASTGIGLEIAKLLVRNGYGVVAVSLDGGRLASAVGELEAVRNKDGPPLYSIALDLSQDGGAAVLHKAVEEMDIGGGGVVDILVNDAGVPVCGPFTRNSLEEEMAMLRLNVCALTGLTKLFLPGMLARGRGRIMNVSSVAGFFPGPGMAVYFASKAYVLSFTEALHRELKGTGVTATALCPGATRTRFMERGGVEASALSRHRMMDAERVAEEGYRGMMRGKRLVVPGLVNKMMVGLGRLAPRGAAAAGVERIIRVGGGRNGSYPPG